VAVLSGASASFPIALAVSGTYVLGMVAPLAALALVWDRRDWSSSKLLQGRQVTVRLGPWRRRMTLGTLSSGLLLSGMGVLTVVVAFTGPGMGSDGWRLRIAADLQHAAAVATRDLSWLPGWAFAVLLAVLTGCVVRQALRYRTGPGAEDEAQPEPLPPACTDTPHHPSPTTALQNIGTSSDD
jgi:hypothetical protein